jgi:hypothetical protein
VERSPNTKIAKGVGTYNLSTQGVYDLDTQQVVSKNWLVALEQELISHNTTTIVDKSPKASYIHPALNTTVTNHSDSTYCENSTPLIIIGVSIPFILTFWVLFCREVFESYSAGRITSGDLVEYPDNMLDL